MEIIAFKNMVWDLTRQISDGMDELFRPISAHYGLTHMQLRILLELWAEPESQTIGSLGRALGVTSGNCPLCVSVWNRKDSSSDFVI